ncbi:MAG: transglycosylase SLT domain-containing protein [Pseudomonadota bacterium]
MIHLSSPFRRASWAFGFALFAAFALPLPGQAQSQAEVTALREAFVLLGEEDLAGAEQKVSGQSELVRDILRWRALRDLGVSPQAVQAFFKKRPDWPQKKRLWRRGESTLGGHSARDVLRYFETYAPQTGEGALALARAQAQSGRPSEARRTAQEAWATFTMEKDLIAEFEAVFGRSLDPAVFDRVQMLLWERESTLAEPLIARLPASEQALAKARVALIRSDAGAAQLVSALSVANRADAGLNYDLFRWHLKAGRRQSALKIILDASKTERGLGQPSRWRRQRETLVRQALDQGSYNLAYALAASHRIESGAGFADLTFLAGFIALRYRNDPGAAAVHFRDLERGVSTPISLGRAGYWLGRALEAQGKSGASAYGRAAQHQTVFYGLLAAQALGQSLDKSFLAERARPIGRETSLLQATRYFLAAGQNGFAALFTVSASLNKSASEQARLAAWAEAQNAPFVAITLAKSAARRGNSLPAPLFAVHRTLGGASPLALGIARKETEMNPAAVSSAGARGLMQLMPGTARDMARATGQSYSLGRLTRDPAYNVSLGQAYLSYLEERFGTSSVYLAAAYNAGPGNVSKWLRDRGDPRTGSVDVIDWIERIPFSETRNYVMRVLEAEEIYAARLRGDVGPIDLLTRLRGAKPVVRPKLRP